ncbi:hypothetical protein T484DRAFT_1816020 [Baffinella frigidus]|nr:hypothetical protein T484DRAFT_1816020 [Cryptophyta sp. CCMP2293]
MSAADLERQGQDSHLPVKKKTPLQLKLHRASLMAASLSRATAAFSLCSKEALYNKAVESRKHKDFYAAERHFINSIAMDHNYTPSLLGLGTLYMHDLAKGDGCLIKAAKMLISQTTGVVRNPQELAGESKVRGARSSSASEAFVAGFVKVEASHFAQDSRHELSNKINTLLANARAMGTTPVPSNTATPRKLEPELDPDDLAPPGRSPPAPPGSCRFAFDVAEGALAEPFSCAFLSTPREKRHAVHPAPSVHRQQLLQDAIHALIPMPPQVARARRREAEENASQAVAEEEKERLLQRGARPHLRGIEALAFGPTPFATALPGEFLCHRSTLHGERRTPARLEAPGQRSPTGLRVAQADWRKPLVLPPPLSPLEMDTMDTRVGGGRQASTHPLLFQRTQSDSGERGIRVFEVWGHAKP